MRASLKTGALIAAVTLAMEALGVLPGRIALGNAQEQLGRSPAEFAIAGTCRDISDLALPIGALGLIVLAIVMIVRRSKSESVRRQTSVRTMTALLAVTSMTLYFISAIAAEFKIERGVDATWFDLQLTKSWGGNPLDMIVGFMFLRRHFVPGIFSLLIASGVLYLFYKRAKTWPMPKRLPTLFGFAAISAAGFGLALIPLDPHVRVFRTITDRHVVGEPFLNLFASFGRSQENVRIGMKVLIERAKFPPEQSQGGEALLGLPERTNSDCVVHPMARSLPVLGVEAAMPGAIGHRELDPDAADAMKLLDQLSAELYEGRTTPIDLWQVMIESYRADDIHAISSAAPRALTPFMNSLYESAYPVEAAPAGASPPPPNSKLGNPAVIAFRNLWQSGSRTSQGLSSYMCGLGMMPYGLSVSRDFGPIPMRCVPDLLVDSDFTGTFFYGGPPSFDEMDTFLRNHGIREVIGQLQQPLSSPTSEVGVSDRAVIAHAVEMTEAAAAADKEKERHGRYLLIMSGSNHAPYRRPDDLPAEIEARVKTLTEGEGFVGTSDDVARLRTFAYTDLALSELYEKVGRGLDRSIFVFGGDHATSDPFVWPRTKDWTLDGAHAKIPYVIVFPEPLLAKSAHPDVVRDLVKKLNAALDRQHWAQNDTPLMLVSLFSHSPGMQALGPEGRWHTLGGARTSPFFKGPSAQTKRGDEQVTVVGIDCKSELFGTNAEGNSILPRETASFVKTADEIYTVSPTLIPVAATFSRFLNGYATTCRDSKQNKHASTL